MYWALFDSTGNLVESYDSEAEARAALERMVEQHPEGADELAIITFDDAGNAVDEAITVDASGSLVGP